MAATKNSEKKPKLLIGRREIVDFPELDLCGIDAKIDSGAWSCAIHCHHIHPVTIDGVEKVHFNLLDPSHADYDEKEFVLPIYQLKTVRSSSGHSEDRYFIQTILRIFDENLTVILSLTDRSDMKYPVLIGRKLLQKRFVVDVSRTNLSARGKIIRCELKRSSSK